MIFIKQTKFNIALLMSIMLIGCNSQTQKKEIKFDHVSLKVLGTIQDGGIPHLGCNKKCCEEYFLNQTQRIGVSSLGISNLKNNKNYLIDATPDINFQLKKLIGNENISKKLNGIFITHAHMGHYSGLLNLGRESFSSSLVPLFVMPKMHEFISSNGPWDQLVKLKNVDLKSLSNNKPEVLGDNLSIVPFLVPHRDEYSETVGYKIIGPNKTALFIPDIDK